MNLWGIIKGLLVQDETDRTKQLSLEVDPSATTGTRTTIKAAQTVNRELTLPDSDSQLADVDSVQEFENKTMDFSSTGTNTLSADAVDVKYDNTGSGLTSSEVQSAIDEVEAHVDSVESDLNDHIAQATDAHDASAISYDNSSSGLAAGDAQAAIDEVEARVDSAESDISQNASDIVTNALNISQNASDIAQNTSDIATNASNLSNHISNPTGAHAASAISVNPAGNLGSNEVQAALEELQSDIDGLSAGSGTMVNLGTGAGVYKEKVLDEFRLRSIKAGTNITVNENADEIEIIGSASGANTSLSNLTATDINENLLFDVSLSRQIGIKDQVGTDAGKTLTVRAGGVSGTQADVSGGNLVLSAGSATGNQGSQIQFAMASSGQANGTTIRGANTVLIVSADNTINTFNFFAPVLGGTNVQIRTQATDNYIINSNISSASAAPGIRISSGGNSGSGATGSAVLESASSSSGVSGAVDVKSGDVSGFGSGNVFLRSGSGTNTGSVTISTGAATGTAGNINLSPGNGSGGYKGRIAYNGALVGLTTTFASYGVVNTVGLPTANYPILIMQTTTAITIHGIEAGVQGQELIIYNENNNNMSFANQSGTETTPANRIITCTGATVTSTGTSMHRLIYLSGRWVLLSNNN